MQRPVLGFEVQLVGKSASPVMISRGVRYSVYFERLVQIFSVSYTQEIPTFHNLTGTFFLSTMRYQCFLTSCIHCLAGIWATWTWYMVLNLIFTYCVHLSCLRSGLNGGHVKHEMFGAPNLLMNCVIEVSPPWFPCIFCMGWATLNLGV